MTKHITNSNNQHVLPRTDGWAVKKAGAMRDTRIFDRQEQAINYAKKVAIDRCADVVIHSKDGRIRDRNSYGDDCHFPKR